MSQLLISSQDPQGRLLLCTSDPLNPLRISPGCDCAPGGGAGGGGCDWDVTPATIDAPKEGGDYNVAVDTYSGCSWETEKIDTSDGTGWFSVVPSSGLSKNLSLQVQVDANSGSARSGTIRFKTAIASNLFGPAGSTIQDVVINQEAAIIPVPAICPGHPPLLDQYTVSGGPINKLFFSGSCFDNDSYSGGTTFPGIVTKTVPCSWAWTASAPNYGNWGGKFLSSIGITLDTSVPGSERWVLSITGRYTFPPAFYFGRIFYKTTGSTPVGIYTTSDSCAPESITVS